MIDRSIFKFAGADLIIKSLSTPKRFKDIQIETKLTPSTVDRRIKQMMEERLIKRIYEPKDRSEQYKLTTQGEKYLKFLDSTDTFGDLFELKIGDLPLGELISTITDIWKETPEQDKQIALEKTKILIVDELSKEAAKAFEKIHKPISEQQVKEILEKVWDLLLESWQKR